MRSTSIIPADQDQSHSVRSPGERQMRIKRKNNLRRAGLLTGLSSHLTTRRGPASALQQLVRGVVTALYHSPGISPAERLIRLEEHLLQLRTDHAIIDRLVGEQVQRARTKPQSEIWSNLPRSVDCAELREILKSVEETQTVRDLSDQHQHTHEDIAEEDTNNNS